MKNLLVLFLFYVCSFNIYAATRVWIGTVNGNYSDAINWAGGVTPINTDDVIFNTNTTVNIDGTFSPNSLTISNNASVIFTTTNATTYTIGAGMNNLAFSINANCSLSLAGSAGITLKMAPLNTGFINGVLDIYGTNSKFDFTNGGNVTVSGAGKIRSGGSSANNITSAALTMQAGSVYEIYKNEGSIGTGTFDDNATLLITGSTTNLPAILGVNYGKIEINTPAGVYNNLNASFLRGSTSCYDFTIINSGTGEVPLFLDPGNLDTLFVRNNFNLFTGTKVSMNRSGGNRYSAISVFGNLNIAGTLTESNGATIRNKLILAGSNTQNISLTGAIENDVSVEMNGAGLKIALTDITLSVSPNARLIFTQGNLDMLTNNKLLYFQNPVSTACISGSVISHVIGKMKRNTSLTGPYLFPVSRSANYFAPCQLLTDDDAPSDFTVEFLENNINKNQGLTPGDIDKVVNYVWDIKLSPSQTRQASVELGYSNYPLNNIVIPSETKVVHWNGTTWENKGGFSAFSLLGCNSILSDVTCRDFSPYSLGGASTVLPIYIEFFKGYKQAAFNILDWKISCVNTSFVNFTLERSANGTKFTTLNSQNITSASCLQDFTYIDRTPLFGTNYYRLKTTTSSGEIKYSNIVVLLNKVQGFELVNFKSNPTKDIASLDIISAAADKIEIMIVDMTGKIISKKFVRVISGSNVVSLDLSTLPTGVYNIVANNTTGENKTARFVKYN